MILGKPQTLSEPQFLCYKIMTLGETMAFRLCSADQELPGAAWKVLKGEGKAKGKELWDLPHLQKSSFAAANKATFEPRVPAEKGLKNQNQDWRNLSSSDVWTHKFISEILTGLHQLTFISAQPHSGSHGDSEVWGVVSVLSPFKKTKPRMITMTSGHLCLVEYIT